MDMADYVYSAISIVISIAAIVITSLGFRNIKKTEKSLSECREYLDEMWRRMK